MANDEQTIRDLQQRWMEAWQKNDLTTLEIILAPEFLLTLSTDPTKPMNRADWLRLALSDYRCEAFNYEKIAVRIFDGWALVGSRYRQKASVKGVDRSGEFFLTDVWRRSGDNWQVIGRYSSFPEPLSQSTEALK